MTQIYRYIDYKVKWYNFLINRGNNDKFKFILALNCFIGEVGKLI